MLIDWIRLVGALLLLLTPTAVFQGDRVRFRAIDRSWERYWTRILTLGLHSIDFVRAVLGNWLLIESLTPAANAHGMMRFAPLIIAGSVRVLAVAVQTAVCREPDSA